MHLKHHLHRTRVLALAIAILIGLALLFSFTRKAHSTIGVTDTHEHIQSLARAEDLLKAMDALGIERTVLIPSPIETLTMKGDGQFSNYRSNVDEILKIAATHPGRFVPFCTLSPKDSDALDYLRDCVKRGGKGLKLYNGHSLFYDGFGMPLDAPAMEPIYAYAEETRLPVLYHVNLDQYGVELEAVLRAHPHLIVSIPHFMVTGSLGRAGRLLELYPNLYTDISFGFEPFMAAGFEKIGKDLAAFKRFILAHQDRILFGADMVLTDLERKDTPYMKTMLGCYKNLLEKGSFRCDAITQLLTTQYEKLHTQAEACKPQSGKFCAARLKTANEARKKAKDSEKLKGLNLPTETLELIYAKNAERFLASDKR
ncbi:amidohydrolase family protein [Candidatus Peregrinibacteria bacterium]|nr:amidohydrolase family protein [Candidatus Peregrinibacteria bacterium]